MGLLLPGLTLPLKALPQFPELMTIRNIFLLCFLVVPALLLINPVHEVPRLSFLCLFQIFFCLFGSLLFDFLLAISLLKLYVLQRFDLNLRSLCSRIHQISSHCVLRGDLDVLLYLFDDCIPVLSRAVAPRLPL